MSYQLTFSLYTTAGLDDLRAQLFDIAGTNSGAAVSTGFVEVGTNGMYLWTGTIPDSFIGGVKFYSLASASDILGICAMNPLEAENSDVKTSSLEITTAVMQAIADALLGRSVATVEGTASTHSLAELILGLLESTTAGTTWTIKRTDGSSTFNTRTLTLDSAALPVTGVA